MVDEQDQTNDQRISMYVRIAMMLFGLFLLFAVYLFILPSVAPGIVAEYIVEPRVVLRAYYSSDDKELTNTLRKRFIRYSGEDTARLALEGLDYADEERRIKSMRLLFVSNREMCYAPLISVYRDQTRSDNERYTALRVLNHIGQLEIEDLHFLIDNDFLRDYKWLRLLEEQLETRMLNADLKQRINEKITAPQNTLKESVEVAVIVNDKLDELLLLFERLLTLHDIPNQRRAYSYLIKCLSKDPQGIFEAYVRSPGYARDLWIELLSLEFQVLPDQVKQTVLTMHQDIPAAMAVGLVARWAFKPNEQNACAVLTVLNAYPEQVKMQRLHYENYAQLLDHLSAAPSLGILDKIYLQSHDTVLKALYLASIMQSIHAQDIMTLSTHIALVMEYLDNRKAVGHHLIDQALMRSFKMNKQLQVKQLLGVATYAKGRPRAFKEACKLVAFEHLVFNNTIHLRFYDDKILSAWYTPFCAREGSVFLQFCKERLRRPQNSATQKHFNQTYKKLFKDPAGKIFLSDVEAFLQQSGRALILTEAMQATRQGPVK